jgi:hypothetical protein
VTAIVTRLRPKEFYAVVPGHDGNPGSRGEPAPVGYERTLDGMSSAIVHARLLSAGGRTQTVLLITGRRRKAIMQFVNGEEITGKLAPVSFHPATVTELRPGSPKGHIPEVCSTAKNRRAGRTPRKNPNCPAPSWPGIDITTRR